MNLNSVQLGGIQFEGKHSRADGKVLTITNVPANYDREKVDKLFYFAKFKKIPVLNYSDID